MRLVQFVETSGDRRVAVVDETETQLQLVDGMTSVYSMAVQSGRRNSTLASIVNENLSDQFVDYQVVVDEQRLLPPLDHPDPAHCHVTGTGLTHLGSAKARDSMHAPSEKPADEPVTDSMRLFQWGIDGGKNGSGPESVQPEWFYKGNGYSVTAPEHSIHRPGFALDAGEEPEIVGLYVIDEHCGVMRVGFALGNEASDHVMERQNYLYLAHSKLRSCSFGPELLVGPLPPDIQGDVTIVREDEEIWTAPFLTGEENMSYSIANLEHHHFKYEMFRSPGDVHCHFFGTSTLSFSSGIETRTGDVFQISAPTFGRPLRNRLEASEDNNEQVFARPL